ncbi:NADP-dependent oxidoreductase [Aquihabitans sp. G128]|uniref:NADP-dependent oxidoreductase n=1 Tax=Aquihabitans sp. G128 TaxID=2849779 RepID=UPI001C24FCD0|nr:NADP-dependent oxidoreductase [Aquihabitans sp. G128]QXC62558.1 NADP-dependent oxidoreductase [Aquihabitans sp. G128]
MTDTSRRLVLARRPEGMVDDTVVRVDQVPVPVPGEGEAVVRVRYLSIDPTIRTWMDDAPGYLPPIELGAVIRSGGIGEVVASNSEHYAEGDTVFGMLGWQDHAVVGGPDAMAQVVPGEVDPTAALSVFGTTGMTAYFGLLDVGKPEEGDTVVVSGAAGATGSVVGQIAKAKGAGRVVGIAGSDEKCAWLVDELGFDGAVNYKTEDVAARLRELCPDGIDVYFDNVGGEILDTCLGQLAMKARVVCCGAISAYNDRGAAYGLTNYFTLITKRARMEGFLILDYLDRFGEAQGEMLGWVLDGKVKHAVHVVDGLEHATDALNLLFTGGNTGKVIVKLED